MQGGEPEWWRSRTSSLSFQRVRESEREQERERERKEESKGEPGREREGERESKRGRGHGAVSVERLSHRVSSEITERVVHHAEGDIS